MKHSYLKKLLYVLLPILILATQTTVLSCKGNGKKNGKNEIVVTVDANGKADGSHRFSKIDDSNFYIDDIRYTAQNGDLIVSGYDEAFFKGEAKLISQLNYNGREMRVFAIGEEAFDDCKVLTTIVIPPYVTSIGKKAFAGCWALTSVSIPNSVTTIDESVFSGCNKITSINLPEHINKIGKGAFSGCSGLTSIIIPKGITEIEDFTFMSCLKLAYVYIPENVTSIGNSSFLACDNIKYVNIKAKTPPTINMMTFANHAKPTLSVPLGCKAAYESTQYWNGFQEIIEE